MKRYTLLLSSMLVTGLVLLGACTQAPTATPTLEPTAVATATQVIPSPTPTQEPVLPCTIAFDSDRDGNREVYTMNPDGSNQVNLTQNPADDFEPVWSPDGTHIAFVSNRPTDDGGQYIYTMQADGTDVVQISKENDSQMPNWSPLGSQIAYFSKGDIYLINIFEGTEVRLTDSPEKDENPKISPDGQQIAWLKGEGDGRTLYVMNIDGSNVVQVTKAGTANDIEWSVDGRLFTHWNQPDGICFNCIVSADGTDVQDAGGKGTIQEFLPFWTDEGDCVELISGDQKGNGFDDIILVGEVFTDIFKPLTADAGNNRNPDTAAKCGPTHGYYPRYGEETAQPKDTTQTTTSGGSFVIGYTGSIDPTMQLDFDTACSELDVECVHGESISALMDQGVDAIVNASNRWDAMGSGPIIHEAASKGIPLFMLNAESEEPGVYNLSVENEITNTTLSWMAKTLNGQSVIAFYNYGKSDYMQKIVDAFLKENPGITPISFTPNYGDNPFADGQIQTILVDHPSLGGVWASDPQSDLFWAVKDASMKTRPLIECVANKEMLINWKNTIDAGVPLKCISYIRPGGTGYEGIYVAFLYLNGSKFRSDAFAEGSSNTLRYDLTVITNDTLPEWIGPKLEALRGGEKESYSFLPMTPQEIKAKWFE